MWYFWEKNSSIARVQKKFLIIGYQVSTDAWIKWLMLHTYREYFKLQVYDDLKEYLYA